MGLFDVFHLCFGKKKLSSVSYFKVRLLASHILHHIDCLLIVFMLSTTSANHLVCFSLSLCNFGVWAANFLLMHVSFQEQ